MIEWLSGLNDLLMNFATGYTGSGWVFLFLSLFILLDGIVPIFPSESLVIGLGALAISTGEPNIWIVAGVAVLGAMSGDLVAYSIGRSLSAHHLRLLQGKRLAGVMNWASEMIVQRPAPVIISARYIPVGRVAVNFMAGRMAYPRRAFLFYIAIAAVTWSIYSCLIGVGAGAWLEGHPILAVPVGVAGGVAIGFIVDRILHKILVRRVSHGKPTGTLMSSVELARQQREVTITEVILDPVPGSPAPAHDTDADTPEPTQ